MKPGLKTGALALLLTTIASPAMAGPIYCEGEYGEVELEGNLEVAQPCALRGTEVDGNIRLYEGGSLIAINAEIDGNLHAKRGDFVDIRNSKIDGNIKLDEMVGDVSFITDSTIDGNIDVKKNRSQVELRRNFVDDNVDASDNRGGVYITNNVIDGNLKCDKNEPAPIVENNSVAGKLEKQCDLSEPSQTPTGPGPDTGGDDNGSSDTGGGGTGDNDTGDNDTGGGGTGSNDTPVSGNEPPVLNVGTGGGGSMGILLLAMLLARLLRTPIGEYARQENARPRGSC